MGAVAVSTTRSAEAQVKASVATRARLLEQIGSYRQLAAAAAAGSREQVAALNMAAAAQTRLARSSATTAAEQRFLMSGGAKPFDTMRGGIDRAHGSLSKLNRGFIGLTGFGAGFVGVAAGGLALRGIIGSAAGFQQTMNIFGAVSQASAGQMAAAGREAIALGNDVKLPATSAADAALAMTELSKAGLSVKDTIGAAHGVLMMSAAAQISNSDAAAIAARNLNAFGLQGREATHVADLLAAAANATSGEMTDVADALSYTASTAAQAHIPITDTVAAIGELANKGIIGGMAGAALQQMLLRLESPTLKAKDAMQRLGISIYDQHGKMLPLRNLIEQFSEKTRGMSDAQRNAAMNSIFGARAIRAANIVLLGGVDAYDRMRGAVDRQGAAAALSAARNKGLKGAWDAMKSALETLAIRIGTKMLPALERWTRGIANWLGNAHNQDKIINALTISAHALSIAFKAAIPVAFVLGIRRASLAMRGLLLTLKIIGPAAATSAVQSRVAMYTIGTSASTATGQVFGLRAALMSLGKVPMIAGAALLAYGFSKAFTTPLPKKVAPSPVSDQTIGGANIVESNGKYYIQAAGRLTPYHGPIPGKGISGPTGSPLPDRGDRPRGFTTPATVKPKGGAGGGGGGGGGRGKIKDFVLPMRIQFEAAKALTQSAQLAAARDALDATNKLIDSGHLSGKALIDAYQERRGLYDQLASAEKEQAAKLADKKKKHKEALAKARLFTIPLAFQVAQARADALASGGDGDGPSKLQVSLARRLKAMAMKAIKSHKLSMQGLIDAWGAIGQAAQTLAQQAKNKGLADTYHAVSSGAFVKGLNFASLADKKLAMERYAQTSAHRGYAPSAPAALGQPAIHIENLHIDGMNLRNIDQIAAEIHKRARSKTQRSGTRQ